ATDLPGSHPKTAGLPMSESKLYEQQLTMLERASVDWPDCRTRDIHVTPLEIHARAASRSRVPIQGSSNENVWNGCRTQTSKRFVCSVDEPRSSRVRRRWRRWQDGEQFRFWRADERSSASLAVHTPCSGTSSDARAGTGADPCPHDASSRSA